FDQTPEQESPFWPRGASRESFRCGCGGGCHNLCLILLADGDAVAQRKQNWVELLRCVDEPVEFLNALCVKVIRRGRSCRFSRPQRVVGNEQSASAKLGPSPSQKSALRQTPARRASACAPRPGQ